MRTYYEIISSDRRIDLTETEYNLLSAIATEGYDQLELRKRMQCSFSSINVLAGKLYKKGLVEREQTLNRVERPKYNYSLSEQGKALLYGTETSM